jgi:hypothetical protein
MQETFRNQIIALIILLLFPQKCCLSKIIFKVFFLRTHFQNKIRSVTDLI